MGPVTNVVLFDKEAEGVASVRFGNAEAATACVDVSNPFPWISRASSRQILDHFMFANPISRQ